ncbi:MAG TPA: Ldh family oxidoreductase [Burkholderiales bacterium]|nr:Ldh family oxidoreductase [Burkholderiales bacterium]
METVKGDSVLLNVPEASALGERGLLRIGYSAEEARIITEHLVDSELCGYGAIGLTRILTIAEHPRSAQPRTPIRIVHETPVSALMDGGNYVGLYAVHRATEVAIDKARSNGFALVGMHNAFLSGRNAFYLEKIARAGFVGIHTACGEPSVAPLGGAAPAFGTNPIAFGLPNDPDPLIFDMGTSALMRGDLILARRLGNVLPEGAAIDAQGRPTRDPVAAIAGSILPFGGHKGSGLALMVQALGLLGGAALPRGNVQDFAFLFVVFEPGLLVPAAELKTQLKELLSRVRATPTQPGVDAVRIPSERAFQERERRRSEGIRLPRAIYERLKAL